MQNIMAQEALEEALYNENGKLILKNNQYKPTVKKWCEKNFLSHRLLKRVSSNSKQTSRILNQVMRDYDSKIQKYKNNKGNNKNLELLLKEMESEVEVDEKYIMRRNGKGYLELESSKNEEIHSNILRALLDGFKIHLCKKTGNKYTTCFPLRSSTCMVDRDSTLMYSKSSSDFIIYSELFDLGSVKLNMANKLTDTILKDQNLKHLFDRRNKRNQKQGKRNISTKGMNAKGAVNKMRELSKKGKKGQKVRVKRKNKK